MFETWKPKDWVARKIADERAIRIATLKEALVIVAAVEYHPGTPAYYFDNWAQQALNKRIAELEKDVEK